MMESEDFFWFWLGISGVSARRLDAVLSVYSPVEIWEKIGGELSDPYPFGEKAYDALIEFAKLCKQRGGNVVFSVVDSIGEADVAECKKLAEKLGIPLRIRIKK